MSLSMQSPLMAGLVIIGSSARLCMAKCCKQRCSGRVYSPLRANMHIGGTTRWLSSHACRLDSHSMVPPVCMLGHARDQLNPLWLHGNCQGMLELHPMLGAHHV